MQDFDMVDATDGRNGQSQAQGLRDEELDEK